MKGRFRSRVQPENPDVEPHAKKAPIVRLPPEVECRAAAGARRPGLADPHGPGAFDLRAACRRIHTGADRHGHRHRPDARAGRHEARAARPAAGLSAFSSWCCSSASWSASSRWSIAAPLSFWIGRLPQIWAAAAGISSRNSRQPLEAIKRSARGAARASPAASGVTVSVDDGSAVESVATLAPAVVAQILIFLASLYFFVATRHQTRTAILKLCFTRRLRWRVAHIFRDVETLVSRYLLVDHRDQRLRRACCRRRPVSASACRPRRCGARWRRSPTSSFSSGPLLMTIILFAVGLDRIRHARRRAVPPLVYRRSTSSSSSSSRRW